MPSIPGVAFSRNLCPLKTDRKHLRLCREVKHSQTQDKEDWAKLACPFPFRGNFQEATLELQLRAKPGTGLNTAEVPLCWLRSCGAQVQEDLQIRPIKIVLTVPNRRLQKCTYFLSLIQAFAITSSAFHPSSPSTHSTAQLYLQ